METSVSLEESCGGWPLAHPYSSSLRRVVDVDADLEAGTEADTEWAQASLQPSAEMAVAARMSA